MATMLVRAPSGAGRREVPIRELRFPKIVSCSPGRQTGVFVRHYPVLRMYEDNLYPMYAVAVGRSSHRPLAFYIPDLWHIAHDFHDARRDLILDAWHLGFDLAEHLGYSRLGDQPLNGAEFVDLPAKD